MTSGADAPRLKGAALIAIFALVIIGTSRCTDPSDGVGPTLCDYTTYLGEPGVEERRTLSGDACPDSPPAEASGCSELMTCFYCLTEQRVFDCEGVDPSAVRAFGCGLTSQWREQAAATSCEPSGP